MDIAKASANILTLSRLLFSPVVFILILARNEDMGASWYLFVLAFLVGISDLFDGILARHYKTTSRWGAFFDPLADKVIVLGAGLCFVFVDRYWILPIIFLFAREVLIGLLRLLYTSKGYTVPASFLAKIKTTFQGSVLTLAACPLLVDARVLHTVLIWIAVAITLVTGAEYLAAIPKLKRVAEESEK